MAECAAAVVHPGPPRQDMDRQMGCLCPMWHGGPQGMAVARARRLRYGYGYPLLGILLGWVTNDLSVKARV